MKRWPDVHSPWGKRLWFESHEFDDLMDGWRAAAGGECCFTPGRGVDVDHVLLRAVKGQVIEADYADLPAGVLGRTCFARDGAIKVELSRELAESATVDATARRRLRSTLAHECGHIACHRELFPCTVGMLSLFGDAIDDAPRVPPMLCRHEAVGHMRYTGEWWEHQANQCMAALLLPRGLFANSVREALAERSFATFAEAIARGAGEEITRELGELYDVSLTVTLYRLEALGFVPSRWQGTLVLEGC